MILSSISIRDRTWSWKATRIRCPFKDLSCIATVSKRIRGAFKIQRAIHSPQLLLPHLLSPSLLLLCHAYGKDSLFTTYLSHKFLRWTEYIQKSARAYVWWGVVEQSSLRRRWVGSPPCRPAKLFFNGHSSSDLTAISWNRNLVLITALTEIPAVSSQPDSNNGVTLAAWAAVPSLGCEKIITTEDNGELE